MFDVTCEVTVSCCDYSVSHKFQYSILHCFGLLISGPDLTHEQFFDSILPNATQSMDGPYPGPNLTGATFELTKSQQGLYSKSWSVSLTVYSLSVMLFYLQ